jgi:alpha-glucosidase
MPWSTEPNAGFCPPDAEPWLPIAPDLAGINVEVQLGGPRSLLTLTRRLLTLRRSSPALTTGSYRALAWPGVSDGCYLFVRETEGQGQAGERMLVALNFSGEVQRISVPERARARPLISTHLDRDGDHALEAFELRPAEGLLLAFEQSTAVAG